MAVSKVLRKALKSIKKRLSDRKASLQDLAEEQCVFHRLANQDFQEAELTIERILQVEDKIIQHALIKVAVVSYARPFSKNFGVHKSYRLPAKEYVPREMYDLHKKMMIHRNQVFAHTDITARSPQMARFKGREGFVYPMSFRGFPPDEFLPLVPQMKGLVKSVMEKNIQAERRILHDVFDKVPYQPRQKSPS